MGKILLSEYALQDLRWWLKVLKSGKLNGVPFDWILKDPSDADVVVKTDASSLVGIGGFSTEGRAFQVRLSDTVWHKVNIERPELEIQILELAGALIAAKLWHHRWEGKCVTFYNDNDGAAAAIIKKSVRNLNVST